MRKNLIRFGALITSICLIVSLFAFSVSAEENSLATIKWRALRTSGYTGWYYSTVTEGVDNHFSEPQYDLRDFTFRHLGDDPFIVVFRITAFSGSYSTSGTQTGSLVNPIVGSTNSAQTLAHTRNSACENSIITLSNSGGYEVENLDYSTNSFWFYFKIYPAEDNVNNITLTLNTDLPIKLTNGISFRLVFDNITYISSDYVHFETIEDMLDDGFSQSHTDFTQLINAVNLLNSTTSNFYHLFAQQSYNLWDLWYDNDGIGHFATRSGNFPNAVSSTLTSIGTYLQHLVELENRSMAAGAGDLLDSLDMDSDFGALTDFGSIGSISTWSGSDVGSAGEEGLLDWFSSENASALDQVGTRDIHDGFVDFYSEHIFEIINWGD